MEKFKKGRYTFKLPFGWNFTLYTMFHPLWKACIASYNDDRKGFAKKVVDTYLREGFSKYRNYPVKVNGEAGWEGWMQCYSYTNRKREIKLVLWKHRDS